MYQNYGLLMRFHVDDKYTLLSEQVKFLKSKFSFKVSFTMWLVKGGDAHLFIQDHP